jgi:hypothetical protein
MAVVSSSFYSDRTGGSRPRDIEQVPTLCWRGLVALLGQRIDSHWFAVEFPVHCDDGNGVIGTDRRNLVDLLEALIPGVEWPLDRQEVPATETVLDLLDFFGARAALPVQGTWHSYLRHHELTFDVKAGRRQFRADVNQVLARSNVAYEMTSSMEMVRLGPAQGRKVVADLRPATGDPTLDELIIEARTRFLSRKPGDDRVALERLWDAFERLKTLEPGKDKKASMLALLERVAEGRMRDVLEAEAKALTDIGNQMQIRHFESRSAPIDDRDIDYLYLRLATLVVHLLRETDRLMA